MIRRSETVIGLMAITEGFVLIGTIRAEVEMREPSFVRGLALRLIAVVLVSVGLFHFSAQHSVGAFTFVKEYVLLTLLVAICVYRHYCYLKSHASIKVAGGPSYLVKRVEVIPDKMTTRVIGKLRKEVVTENDDVLMIVQDGKKGDGWKEIWIGPPVMEEDWSALISLHYRDLLKGRGNWM